jgi:26S proteasome regulatory subunit N2
MQDKDPILRRSGMYSIAMSYCGCGNNEASRKLLHVAVITYLLNFVIGIH